MSKPVKDLIVADYQRRFGTLENALLIEVRGINAKDTNRMRIGLKEKKIRVTVLKNTLARRAFAGSGLAALAPGLTGPSALAYGAESVVDVARELVEWARKIENLRLKGAILDGEYFEGQAGVERLSRFPTRGEAIAQVVQLVLSPGAQAVGCVTGPGGAVMGIVEEIIKKLEKSETTGSSASG